MPLSVAVIGLGVNGLTNAVRLLEQGFKVTIFSKDKLLETNSAAAVATWYAPDNSRPKLQQLCIDSLSKFDELSGDPQSGVQRIPIIYYFKDQEEFSQSALGKEELKQVLKVTDKLPAHYVAHADFPFSIVADIPLIDPSIYLPFLLNKFQSLGGQLNIQEIKSLDELTNQYNVVVYCSGWEAKSLGKDPSIFPVRGQIEVTSYDENTRGLHSINIAALNAYVVLRPQSQQLVIGTMYQVYDSNKGIREAEREEMFQRIAPFFPQVNLLKTTSIAGIRCGRSDALVESKIVENQGGEKVVLAHCYGQGGSGFSASWGSANEILQQILAFSHELKQSSTNEMSAC
jgi:D-amino-acid oxidase